MDIEKEIISKIERDYFFIEGQLDVKNPQYFINKIEEGIRKDDNLNHKTNVRGHHTALEYVLILIKTFMLYYFSC